MKKHKIEPSLSNNAPPGHWRHAAMQPPLLSFEWKKLAERLKKKFKGKKGVVPKGPHTMPMDTVSLTHSEEIEVGILEYKALRDKANRIGNRLEKAMPHAQRGAKITEGAKKGGRANAHGFEHTRKQYRAALVEYMKAHGRPRGTVSLTAARERIAEQYFVSRRTMERHTKDLFRK